MSKMKNMGFVWYSQWAPQRTFFLLFKDQLKLNLALFSLCCLGIRVRLSSDPSEVVIDSSVEGIITASSDKLKAKFFFSSPMASAPSCSSSFMFSSKLPFGFSGHSTM